MKNLNRKHRDRKPFASFLCRLRNLFQRQRHTDTKKQPGNGSRISVHMRNGQERTTNDTWGSSSASSSSDRAETPPSPPPVKHVLTATNDARTPLQLWNEDSFPNADDDGADPSLSMISAVTLDPYLHFVSKYATTSKSPTITGSSKSSNNNRRDEKRGNAEPHISQSFIRDVVTTTRYEL